LHNNGTAVGIVFGFLKSLLMLSKQFESNRFAFAWDSRRSIRKIWQASYKEDRKKDRDIGKQLEDFQQFDLLRRTVLPWFGFKNIFLRSGFEGDDVIAEICKSNPDEEMAIVSSDNDLWQLLTDRHFMFDMRKKKAYTKKDFVREWKLQPEDWVRVKSIAGCNGDNVPGIPGVGNVTAVKYLKGDLPQEGKVYKNIEQAFEDGTVERTRNLVEIPFPGLGSIPLLNGEVFRTKDFFDICDRYGFRSLVAQQPVWRDYFDMKGR